MSVGIGEHGVPRLKPGLGASLFLRGLFIQGAWNYRGMQNLGMLWSMLPVARLDPDRRREILARGETFYNGHPYLCGFVSGAGARLETEGRGTEFSQLKRAASGPLGAVGDRLFWYTLKPASGAVAGLGALLLLAGLHWAGLLMLIVAVLGYNIPQLRVRLRALYSGYEDGLEIGRAIADLKVGGLQKWSARLLPPLAGFYVTAVLGAGLAHLLGWLSQEAESALSTGSVVSPAAGTSVLLFLAAFAASWQLPRRGWAMPVLLAAIVLISAFC